MRYLIFLIAFLLLTSAIYADIPQPLRNIQVSDSLTADIRWNFDVLEYHQRRLYDGSADLDINGIIIDPIDTQALTASDTISVDGSVLLVAGSGGAITLTSTPTIANGTNGEVILIVGTNDTNTITLQHGTSYNLQMSSGQDFTLGSADLIAYKYNSTIGDWIELFRCNNG